MEDIRRIFAALFGVAQCSEVRSRFRFAAGSFKVTSLC